MGSGGSMHVLVLTLAACGPGEPPTVPPVPCTPVAWYADRDGDGVRGADVVEAWPSRTPPS